MVSRVANRPIKLPSGVSCTIEKQIITVKGKMGQLKHEIPSAVAVQLDAADNALSFSLMPGQPNSNALAGTTRALLNNAIRGVSEGFEQGLVLIGVGYRAKAQGNALNLTVGYSHPVDMKMPQGISVETPTPTEIIVKGIDRQQVSQAAADIRAVRPPEPYKGKGIRYRGEHVVQKEAKKK